MWNDPAGPTRVSCGRACTGNELAIVDVARRVRCDDGVEGEIWVRGASVAGGYFGHQQESRETFAATLRDTPEGAQDETWLRTGDLGCVVDGEVYITGRDNDIVIKNGIKFAAEDLEHTVEQLRLEPLHPSGCAAFGYDDGMRERLVIVSEIKRDAVAAWADVGRSGRRCDRCHVRDAGRLGHFRATAAASRARPAAKSGAVNAAPPIGTASSPRSRVT